jgi:NADH-quinone oxidoreductase subunit M
VPRISGVGLLFALASLGLPGLGNFVAEFLVLLGAYQANVALTVLATLGLITATVYALWMIQQTFHGPNTSGWKLPDLGSREMVVMAAMIVVIVWLGLYPQPVLNTAKPALDQLQHSAASVQQPLMSTPNAQVIWPQLDYSTSDHGSNP